MYVHFSSGKVDGKRVIDLGAGWQTKRMDKNFDLWAVKVTF